MSGETFGDVFVSKYDSGGTRLWTQKDGKREDSDKSAAVSADGMAVYISGHTFGSLGGPNAGVTDAFVSKYGIACEDVVQNAVHAEASGGVIKISFTPRFGLTLNEAAKVCDCEGFNWLSTIKNPDRWRQWRLSGETPFAEQIIKSDLSVLSDGKLSSSLWEISELGSAPLIDPIIDGTHNMYVVTTEVAPGVWLYGPVPQPGSDSQVYYLNLESSALPHPPTTTEYSDDRTLLFKDEPKDPVWAYTNEYAQFVTQLVGMGKDGIPISWSKIGTNVAWKSNGVTAGDIFYFSTRPGEGPALIAGGVFDVSLDSAVPEPRSSVLFGVLAGATFGWFRRVRTLQGFFHASSTDC